MGMFASYDQSVEFFKDNLGAGEGARILGASTVSGLFSAACSLPFDYVKTQIQKMQPDAEGKYTYTGSLDCALKTLKSGGPFKFYTGFPVCGGEKSCCSNSHNESYIFSYPIFILKVTGKPDKA